MEKTKFEPGHTVEFHGLKGAAHLNGTRGHLVKYLKKEQRWAVRCERDDNIVNARPENLEFVKMKAYDSFGAIGTSTRPTVDDTPPMFDFGEPKASQPSSSPLERATTAAGETYYIADAIMVRASGYDLNLLRKHEAEAAVGNVDMQYTLSCSDDIIGSVAAIEWMKIAANNGHPKAQFNLARSYEKGEGVCIDHKEAARWYRLSADQGYMESQTNLGLLYCKGRGVEQSYDEAKVWLEKAAAQGDQLAVRELGVVRMALTAKGLGCGAQWSGREY